MQDYNVIHCILLCLVVNLLMPFQIPYNNQMQCHDNLIFVNFVNFDLMLHLRHVLNRRQVLHRKAGAQRREGEEARRDSDTESRLLMAPDINICAAILDVTEEVQGEEIFIEKGR